MNKQNPLSSITQRQLTDMYMGRTQYFSDGRAALKIDAPGNSEMRQYFYDFLVNMTLPEVNAYWARLMFSGRATPPMQVSNEHDVMQLVTSNPNAIGYVPEQDVNADVKVIFSIQVD
ncbi:hypothetical protein [Vibrio viridaestus]|nr:hypothetical protein [Vibrio viridaestus]